MQRCKDCRFWDQSDSRAVFKGVGECTRWLRGYNISTIPLNEVIVEDDEGWGAEMGPEFGCVLWEKKE